MTRVGYVGNAMPGRRVQRFSREGEVLVKSPGDDEGLLQAARADRAASFTADGFLKTGDRGEIDDRGPAQDHRPREGAVQDQKGKYVAPAPIENLLNADSLLEQSCVTGANQPQPFALILLTEDIRAKLGPDLRTEIEQALTRLRDKVNAQLDPHEHLEFLAIVKEPWLIENGLLTPTMKIKRSVIEERYEPKTETWYGARQTVIWEG